MFPSKQEQRFANSPAANFEMTPIFSNRTRLSQNIIETQRIHNSTIRDNNFLEDGTARKDIAYKAGSFLKQNFAVSMEMRQSGRA